MPGISAIPSGSGMTFLIDSSFDEDGPQNVIAHELLEMQKDPADESQMEVVGLDDDQGSEVDTKKTREITDKFLAGCIHKQV